MRRLIDENRRRGRARPEFELLDTGIFDDDRYFDVFIEYAKAGPEDICIRIEAIQSRPGGSRLFICCPHLWFRNTWAWTDPPAPEPIIRRAATRGQSLVLEADSSNTHPLANLQFEYTLGAHAALRPARCGAYFHGQRDERPARFRPRARQPEAICERCIPSLPDSRRKLRQSGASRHEGLLSLRAEYSRGRILRASPCACEHRARHRGAAIRSPMWMQSSSSASRRPTNSTLRSIRRRRRTKSA